jgi:MoaD family protein
VRVRVFAALRELAGSSWVEVPDGPDVGAVLDALSSRLGARFDAIMTAGTVVVNGDLAGRDHPVGRGDDVALLPPVSGGGHGAYWTFELYVPLL